MTDCALRNRRPPAEKLPSSARAMNMRRWSRETLSSIYRLERWFISKNIGYHDWTRGDIVLWTNSEDSKRDRHFRHCWKHPRGPFLGQAREVDFSKLEEARGCRRAASGSSRLSDAVFRSATNAGHAGARALRERGRATMDRRHRAVRRLRLRRPRVQLRPLRGAQKRDRLGLSRVESQGSRLRELWLRHGRTRRPAASLDGDRSSARPD